MPQAQQHQRVKQRHLHSSRFDAKRPAHQQKSGGEPIRFFRIFAAKIKSITMNQEDFFKKITAHAKEYGFIFPSSEIYDGLSAVYDYGQNGVELKKNIREYWWKAMVQMHENIVGIDAAIFMHLRLRQGSAERLQEGNRPTP